MASVHSSYNANDWTLVIATGQAAQKACCTSQNNLPIYKKPIANLSSSAFLKEDLPAFARANPQIEIRVFPRPTKHPFVRGHFINGNEKAISVRNFKPDEILEKVNLLKQASGEKSKRQKKPVTSLNESVRGIWSPYHGDLKMV